MKQRKFVEVLSLLVFLLFLCLSFQSSPDRTATAFRSMLSLSIAQPVVAQPNAPPYCDLSDSSLVYAQGLDDIMHRFGEDTSTYPNEFNIASFDSAFTLVFDLFVTPNASNGWTTGQWQNMIVAIMNNDTSQTQDEVFGAGWL